MLIICQMFSLKLILFHCGNKHADITSDSNGAIKLTVFKKLVTGNSFCLGKKKQGLPLIEN